jgi:hypothetical protein
MRVRTRASNACDSLCTRNLVRKEPRQKGGVFQTDIAVAERYLPFCLIISTKNVRARMVPYVAARNCAPKETSRS